MPLSSYPTLSGNLRPQRFDKTQDAIADLEAGIARGEIANAVYLRSKEMIGRAVEEAWDKAVMDRFIFNRDYRPDDEIEEGRLREVGYASRPAPHTMKVLLRKVALLDDAAIHKTVIAGFLDELMPLMEQLTHGREIAVKRLTGEAAAEARQAASPIARVSAPVLSRVDTVLRNLTAEARDTLAEQLEVRGERILQEYLKDQEEFWGGSLSPRAAARGYGPVEFSTQIGNGKSVPDIRMLLDALLASSRGQGEIRYQLKPGHQKLLHDMSMTRADEICADFIQRNLVKLAPVFEAKQAGSDLQVIENRVDPRGMNAHLRASFEDGSSFDMKTSVVWSQNQFGTVYVRFPVTFHDVILPDGERMATPSEARMHEIFAVAPPAPESPEQTDEDDPSPGF